MRASHHRLTDIAGGRRAAWTSCPLFENAGIRLGAADARQVENRRLPATNMDTAERLTVADAYEYYPISYRQLSFSFMLPPNNVIKLAPRSSHPYLNYGVYDILRIDRKLVKPALRLEQRYIFAIGQLVQLTEEQVQAFEFINDETFDRMRAQLNKMKLDFGMRIPSWTKRVQRFLTALP